MSSAEPIPGRCGAKTRGGEFCASMPLVGAKRCRLHGGAATGEKNITHGLGSARLRARYADPALQARLAELLDDPNLLDARRAVAASQVALEGIPYEPLFEDGERIARRMLMLGPEDEVPPEAIDTALHELRGVFAERMVSNANAHARTVQVAAKQEKVAEILVRGAVPIMRRFAERVAGLVRKHLPPLAQAEFLQNLAQIVQETQLEIVKFGEDADAGARG